MGVLFELCGGLCIEEALKETEFQGEVLPICGVDLGMLAWFDAIAQDMEQAGFSGEGVSVYLADLFPSLWLFGDFEPPAGAAPWYYGGLPGLAKADYLMVPTCALLLDSRDKILAEIEKAELDLEEVRRTELYILYRKGA